MVSRRKSWVRQLAQVARFFGQVTILLFESCGYILRGQVSAKDTIRQMSEIGVGSILVALITVGFSGAVAALYVAAELVRFSQGGLVGGLVGKSLALEITPVITAIVVSARSGSAMAAELGSMTVTEQVDALRTLATPPTQYLVVPRLVATITMMPIVAVLANLAGLFGAGLTSAIGGVSTTLFWRSFQDYVTVSDEAEGLIKALIFGAIIALVGCRQGLTTSGGAQGVGRATTSAVVFTAMAVYVTDFCISVIIQDSHHIWGLR